jgi:hypothetical protein
MNGELLQLEKVNKKYGLLLQFPKNSPKLTLSHWAGPHVTQFEDFQGTFVRFLKRPVLDACTQYLNGKQIAATVAPSLLSPLFAFWCLGVALYIPT